MTSEPEHEPRTRIRRGKEVVIPEEWVGKTVNRQTIRKRRSKQVRKNRDLRVVRENTPAVREGRAPKANEW